jgi:hypothetical protein
VIARLLSGLDEGQYLAVRLALGVTLACGLAWGIGWTLSFITPLLVVSFLGTETPSPTLKGQLGVLLVVALGALVGLLISSWLIPFPLLCLTVIGYGLFSAFYLQRGGTSGFVVLMLLIAVLVIPLMGLTSHALALIFTVGFFQAGVVALLVASLMHWILPNRREPAPVAPGDVPDARDRVGYAAVRTLVLLPLVFFFYSFSLVDSLVMLVFAAIFAQQTSVEVGLRTAGALLLANVAGGLLAQVVFHLFVAVPTLPMMLLVMFGVVLFIGPRRFSDRPTAALYTTALSTLLVILGPSVMSSSAEPDAKFLVRVLQIALASAYLLVGFSTLGWVRDRARAIGRPAWLPRRTEA